MADENVSSYLASLDVLKKSSDQSVKDALKELVVENKSKKPKTSLEILQAASKPMTRKEVEADYPDLLKKSMIVNNKVANKAISLPEQKVITTSNYNQVIFDKTLTEINHQIDKTNEGIVKDLQSFAPVKAFLDGAKLVEDIKKNFNTAKDAISELFGFGSGGKTDAELHLDELKEVNREPENGIKSANTGDIMTEISSEWLKEIKEASEAEADEEAERDSIKSVNGDNMNEASENWLEYMIQNDNSSGSNFRFNFVVYRYGKNIKQKPSYGKLDPVSLSKLSVTYISKLRRVKRVKQKGYSYEEDSYFKKKGIDFKVKDDLALRVSKPNSASSENKAREKNNPFVRDLLLAGPDLYSNMFDVYLRFNNTPTFPRDSAEKPSDVSDPTKYIFFCPVLIADKKGKATQKSSYVYQSTFQDVYSMSVRTATVDIPFVNRSSTSIPFLNTKVERPSGMVEYDLQGTLSVDCDANTYVNDMFLALAGLQRDGVFRNGKKTELEPIKKDMFDHVSHFPFMAPAKLGFQMSSVDIVVSSHGLGMYNDKTVNPGGGGFFSNILYVFKDVRFLGGSDIKFATESDSSQTVEAGFIARRLETYYKPDNLPFAITQGISRSSLFNGKNLNGQMYDETSITEKDEEK